MPLTDLNLHPVYNHGNCPDMIAGQYEPLLAQAVRYDRNKSGIVEDAQETASPSLAA